MAGDAAPALALLAVQTDSNHALRLDLECDIITYNDLTFGDCKTALSTHCDCCQRRGLDSANACSTACGQANGPCSDRKIGATKRVRNGNLDFRGANRHVEGLTECCVF
jgi:hypothetical protein